MTPLGVYRGAVVRLATDLSGEHPMFTQQPDENQPEPARDRLDVFDVLARATAPTYVPRHRADVPVDSVSAVA
jgi:patatin-like phospholipase/acyl hydrolase